METLLPHQFDPRLRDHIHGIDLQQLSRVPSSRLKQTAIPQIGSIELVSAQAFERSYQDLYLAMFHGGERERPDLIVERLKDDFAGRRSGLAPYRIVGIRDSKGEAMCGAQFSVLMLPGGRYAVPYMQYIYVRAENRRQDLSEVLHTIVLAVATADAKASGQSSDVPFTLFETEPPNHGTTQLSRITSTERTQIHTRSGSQALMLLGEEGLLCSPHVQPGLEPEDNPLTLVWVIRPSPGPINVGQYDVNEIGKALLAAYYRSLRDEGFPEKNIALAEQIAHRRCERRDFVLMPLSEITSEMYQNLDDEIGLNSTTGAQSTNRSNP